MIFVNNTDFKYLVSRSDNYLILTNVPSVNASYNNPADIDTLVQYIYPSTYSYESTLTVSSSKSYDRIDVTDSFWERADSVNIMFGGFFILFLFVFIFNQFTKLVRSGGVLK